MFWKRFTKGLCSVELLFAGLGFTKLRRGVVRACFARLGIFEGLQKAINTVAYFKSQWARSSSNSPGQLIKQLDN